MPSSWSRTGPDGRQAATAALFGQRAARADLIFPTILAALLSCIALLGPGCRQVPPPTDRVKIGIDREGLYRLTAADLRSAGFDLAAVDPARLRLTNRGRVVPARISGPRSEPAVEFYATGVDTRYTGTNVYWLDAADSPVTPLASRPAGPAPGPVASVPASMHFERNATYWSKEGANSGTPWYWQLLAAPAGASLPFTLTHAVNGPAHLRIAFFGANHTARSPDHHVRIAVNGLPVGEAMWDGQVAFEFHADLPAGTVGDINWLSLEVEADGGRPDLVLVDWFEVTYTRALVAEDDELLFEGSGGSYSATGFSGLPVDVFDVTDPFHPVVLTGAVAVGADFTFGDEGRHRYLVAGPRAAHRPASVAPGREPGLRSGTLGADLLIITHPSLIDPTQRLARWRRSQGLRVVTATVDEVYDAFGDGLAGPAAIRDFLRFARDAWVPPAPRFVLLVGAASYDYRDYLGGPIRSLVPTMMLPTAYLGEAPSDNWLVALDAGSRLPSMAVGRLPAGTPAELSIAVDKIIAYEAAPEAADWRRRLVFVADDKDPAFAELAGDLADSLAPGFDVRRIYLRDFDGEERGNRARAEIVTAIDAGALAVTYVGHGAMQTWAAETIFGIGDVKTLKNGSRLPLLITPTCLDGFFAHPHEKSLAEALLWHGGGGIVAAFVPTGLTLAGSQEPLVRAFYKALFEERRSAGEAVLDAKRSLPDGGKGFEDVIETFTLIGDPALRVTR